MSKAPVLGRLTQLAIPLCAVWAAVLNPFVALGETITYSVVDYPAAEADVVNPGNQDRVLGTITASSADPLGSYTAGAASGSPANPINVTLSYAITLESLAPGGATTASVSYTGSGPLSYYLGSGTITFDATSIQLGGYLSLGASTVAHRKRCIGDPILTPTLVATRRTADR